MVAPAMLVLLLALLLNRPVPLRGLILIPWVLPTSLRMIIFRWLFEPILSVLNCMLEEIGMAFVAWLGTPQYAIVSVVLVNIWRRTPFFAVTLLTAL